MLSGNYQLWYSYIPGIHIIFCFGLGLPAPRIVVNNCETNAGLRDLIPRVMFEGRSRRSLITHVISNSSAFESLVISLQPPNKWTLFILHITEI